MGAPFPPSPATKEQVVALVASGVPMTEVAEQVGVHRNTVRKWWAEARGRIPQSRPEIIPDAIAAVRVEEQHIHTTIQNRLGELLTLTLAAAVEQMRVLGDGDWLRKQTAADVLAAFEATIDRINAGVTALAARGEPHGLFRSDAADPDSDDAHDPGADSDA